MNAQIEQARQELLAAPALEEVVSEAAQARQAQQTAYDEALRDVKSGFNINCWKRR